ncbi:MAG: adenylate/guanylate cyclase domain-containing protein [Bacteroidales bacterium]|jgi:class 3 adenylate cyclase/CheY-like chemotaxis protein
MGYKVLVVDDNLNNSRLIEGILSSEQNKYDVFFAEDGVQGFEKARKLQPDLILMDIRMPNLSGLDSLRMLQENKDLREIPVIFITAYKTDENFAEAFEFGAFDFITKPIDINELKSRINKALSIGRTLQRIRAKINRYEEERRLLEEKATITENAPNSFIIIDGKGNLEWVNEGFERLHETSFKEFKKQYGNNIYEIKTFKDFMREARRCFKTKTPSSVETKQILPNGKKWFQTFFTPQLDADGNVFKLIAVESDITPIMIKEEELYKQNRRMLAITERLEQANSLLENQKEEIEGQKRLIEEEQEKSERLLLNILPFEVARQLKVKGKAGTRYYRHVTVVFTDFKDFSKNTKELEPKDLVAILDDYFAKFDEITGKHYLEKIKTIGDAYMCAGGLPLRNKSNPVDAVLACLEITDYMQRLKSKGKEGIPCWDLRIGIHTGPVVAGVVGRKKFAYDIWSETVNAAARIESLGEINKVNISETTYEYVQDYFDCTPRGKIKAKNVGEITMYYVERIKREYSADEKGILPNEAFIKLVNKL